MEVKMKYPDLELSSFFIWSNRPRIMFGPGIRSEIGFEMKALGGKRVLIITDKGVVNAGVAEMVAEAMRGSI
jgi:alcohol dehydrogenase class IV